MEHNECGEENGGRRKHCLLVLLAVVVIVVFKKEPIQQFDFSTGSLKIVGLSKKFFSSSKFFSLAKPVPKIGAFLRPIFRNVDGSWRVTSKLRGSTPIQVTRRRSEVFQRFSASLGTSLELFKVCHDDMPCEKICYLSNEYLLFKNSLSSSRRDRHCNFFIDKSCFQYENF